jgi:hypothetical protein
LVTVATGVQEAKYLFHDTVSLISLEEKLGMSQAVKYDQRFGLWLFVKPSMDTRQAWTVTACVVAGNHHRSGALICSAGPLPNGEENSRSISPDRDATLASAAAVPPKAPIATTDWRHFRQDDGGLLIYQVASAP